MVNAIVITNAHTMTNTMVNGMVNAMVKNNNGTLGIASINFNTVVISCWPLAVEKAKCEAFAFGFQQLQK